MKYRRFLFFIIVFICMEIFNNGLSLAEYATPFFENEFRDAQGFKGTIYDTALFHLGKDYCVNKAGKNPDGSLDGTPFYAIGQGNIIKYRYSVPANYSDGVGNYVIVDHGGGVVAVYMHLAKIFIKSGVVTPDIPLGEAGDVILHGKDNCPHLHLEIRKNGVYLLNVPPNLRYSYINRDGKTRILVDRQFYNENAVLAWIDDNFFDPDIFLSAKKLPNPTQDTGVSPPVKDASNVQWINIMPGETKINIFLSKDGGVYYYGEKVINLTKFEGIKVSQKSKKNGYITIISWDYDKGGIDLFMMDSKIKKVMAKTNYWVDKRMLGSFAEWVSWSPGESFALVSPGGEGIRELSVIDIRTGEKRDIKMKRFEKKYKGNIKEMQIVDIKNIFWKTDTNISVPINIYCNPYEDNYCTGDLKTRSIIEANIDLKNIENISYTNK